MNIFLDEAGVFVVPNKNKCSISCVGALAIPERYTSEIFDRFSKLKESWGVKADEVKGSELAEPEVDSLIRLLAQYDMLFQVTAIDMNRQSNKQINSHIAMLAHNLTKNLTPQHQSGLVDGVNQLKEELKKLTPQLFVQAACTFELLYLIIQKVTLYYSQRLPEELADFYWYVDAKDKKITPFEKFWTNIILPMLQSQSISTPFIQLIGADYSYFSRYCEQTPSPPEYLRAVVPDVSPFEYIAIRDVLQKNLVFEQSHKNLGIQLVDILTTSTRRAMNGKLKVEGWGRIGKLMVQSERGKQAVQLVDFSFSGYTTAVYTDPPLFYAVLTAIEQVCKPILLI